MFWEILTALWHLFLMVVAGLLLVEVWAWGKWWFGGKDKRHIR